MILQHEAVQPVNFDPLQPLTGIQIKEVVNEAATTPTIVWKWFDGPIFEIGQYSGIPEENFIVVPNLAMSFFSEEESDQHTSVLIVNHIWKEPVSHTTLRQDRIVAAICSLQSRLEDAARELFPAKASAFASAMS